MGLIDGVFRLLFGDGRNVVKDTAEVFFENAENAGRREAGLRNAALEQFASEFAVPRKGAFDRFMDGLNRVPRPLMAFGTIGLCVSAMVDPIWFATRMQGIALVPEPLWWLLGSIVSFYFGARYQVKSQEFQSSIAATMARAPVVRENMTRLKELEDSGPSVPGLPSFVPGAGAENPALRDWKTGQAGGEGRQ